MGGPSLDTTKRASRKALKYKVGENEFVFEHLATVYRSVMTLASIPLGSVLVMMAEDETVVKRSIRWVARDDVLLGFYGPVENHKCISDFVVEVGSGVAGYENVVTSFKTNVRAHYARVLIVNPLHPRLPKLVAVIQLTCNKFDNVFMRSQWEKVKSLWDKHLHGVVGPLIGHSSNGDARQRKLMLDDFTSLEGRRFRIPWDGWLFSGRVLPNNDVNGLHDQDFVHNGKKLVNPLDLPTRHLILGTENATLNHIYLVYHNFSVDRHGLQEGDITRDDRQNWTAAQRLASWKVRDCLQQLQEDPNHRKERTKVVFFNTPEAQIVKKRGRPKKSTPSKTWFLGRVYRMCRKVGNRWVEYRDPMDLLDRPNLLEVGLCWYQKSGGSKWTSDLTDHVMVDLDTIIALANLTYEVEGDTYELHPSDEKIFDDFVNPKL